MIKYGEYVYENYYEYNSLANKVVDIIKKF